MKTFGKKKNIQRKFIIYGKGEFGQVFHSYKYAKAYIAKLDGGTIIVKPL